MQEASPNPDQPLIVRQARSADAALLAGLIAQLADHHGDQATTSEKRLMTDLFGPSPWATGLVAEQRGRVLGYALLVRVYNAQFAQRAMDILHLFVLPEARNVGVGQALIRTAITEAEAQGCARLVVGTHPENHQAQSFYRKLGFQDALSGGPKFKLQLRAST